MTGANAEPKPSRTNWAGNITFAADRLVLPETVADVQEAVRGAAKLRVFGARHCFNDIADTPGTQLSLQRMRRLISLDATRRRVTVEGGIRYDDLAPALHARGYALHNLASLPHISVAGACATATHGSGTSLGGLATAVTAIEFVNGRGDLVTLSREQNPDTFPGAVVNFGALGVVVRLTLEVEPAFAVRQDVYRDLPLSALEAHFDEIMSSGYSVSLFTAWQGETVEQVWVKNKVAAGGDVTALPDLFGARPATRNMHPIADRDATSSTDQLGVAGPSYDRLPHFRNEATLDEGSDMQSEYFVAQEHAVAAVRSLARQGSRLAPMSISEVRTVAADDLWMSPFYRQASVAFHFSFKPDYAAVARAVPVIEEILAPYRPLPHWGKVFTLRPRSVAGRYARLADFRALLAEHDPAGKFRNAYVDRNIFAAA